MLNKDQHCPDSIPDANKIHGFKLKSSELSSLNNDLFRVCLCPEEIVRIVKTF